MQPRDWKFRALLAACASAFAVGIGATVSVARSAERTALREWDTDLHAASRHGAETVDSWLDERRALLRLTASFPTVGLLAATPASGPSTSPADPGLVLRLRPLFDSVCRESGSDSLSLLDRDGSVWIAGGPRSPSSAGTTPLGELASRDAASLEIDDGPDGCVVSFSEPVRAPGSERVRLVLVLRENVSHRLAAELAWIGRTSQTGDTFLVLRRSRGWVALTHVERGLALVPLEALSPPLGGTLRRAAEGIPADATFDPSSASEWLASSAPLKTAPWSMAVVVRRSEAVEAEQSGALIAVALSGLGVMGVLLCVLAVGSGRRLRRLREEHAWGERVLSAIGQSRDVVLFLDEGGVIVEAIGATERIYGRSPASLLGLRLEQLRAPESRRPPEGVPPETAYHVERGPESHLRADGTVAEVELGCSPVQGANGKQWCLVLVHDIAGRRAAEEARRTLVRAIEQNPTSIVITDAAGTIQYVNPQVCRLTGYAAAELVGRNPKVLKSNLTPPEVYADLWKTIASGRVWRGEMVNRRKDGSLFTERASIGPVVDDRGTITHYVAVKEDLTEHLELEARATAAEKGYLMAQKLEAVGRLAGGVAHDFNNLLTVDLRLQRAAARSAPPEADPPARRCSTEVSRARRPRGRPDAAAPRLQPHAGPRSPGSLDLNAVVARDREDAPPAHRRGHRAAHDGPRAEPRRGAGRPRPARAGDRQPGGQRPRRDAHGRRADHRDARRSRPTSDSRPSHAGTEPGPLRHARRPRHRRAG